MVLMEGRHHRLHSKASSSCLDSDNLDIILSDNSLRKKRSYLKLAWGRKLASNESDSSLSQLQSVYNYTHTNSNKKL